VTGAERQSKAEPDEDGKALGGSAVHYKRSSNTLHEEEAKASSFFCLQKTTSPHSLSRSCNSLSFISVCFVLQLAPLQEINL